MQWFINKAEGDLLGQKFLVEFKTPIKVELRDEDKIFPGYEISAEIEAPETKNPEAQIFWGTPGEKIKAIYKVKRIIEPNEIVIEA